MVGSHLRRRTPATEGRAAGRRNATGCLCSVFVGRASLREQVSSKLMEGGFRLRLSLRIHVTVPGLGQVATCSQQCAECEVPDAEYSGRALKGHEAQESIGSSAMATSAATTDSSAEEGLEVAERVHVSACAGSNGERARAAVTRYGRR